MARYRSHTSGVQEARPEGWQEISPGVARYRSHTSGVQEVRPEGWQEISPGVVRYRSHASGVQEARPEAGRSPGWLAIARTPRRARGQPGGLAGV